MMAALKLSKMGFDSHVAFSKDFFFGTLPAGIADAHKIRNDTSQRRNCDFNVWLVP
jgi:hypothetical protein